MSGNFTGHAYVAGGPGSQPPLASYAPPYRRTAAENACMRMEPTYERKSSDLPRVVSSGILAKHRRTQRVPQAHVPSPFVPVPACRATQRYSLERTSRRVFFIASRRQRVRLRAAMCCIIGSEKICRDS